jgi:cysteinyl-tRNA synthetase
MNDDLNTAKVLASLFELVPIINGIKDKHIAIDAISAANWQHMKTKVLVFVTDILGLLPITESGNNNIEKLMQLLINIRSEAKKQKNYATSDAIRNGLQEAGFALKDEKDGNTSWSML